MECKILLLWLESKHDVNIILLEVVWTFSSNTTTMKKLGTLFSTKCPYNINKCYTAHLCLQSKAITTAPLAFASIASSNWDPAAPLVCSWESISPEVSPQQGNAFELQNGITEEQLDEWGLLLSTSLACILPVLQNLRPTNPKAQVSLIMQQVP